MKTSLEHKLIFLRKVIYAIAVLCAGCGGGESGSGGGESGSGGGTCVYDCSDLNPYDDGFTSIDVRSHDNKSIEWCVVNRGDCRATYNGESISGYRVYYEDRDNDRYGNMDSTLITDDHPPGWVLRTGDCDDTDPLVNPEVDEVIDGVDNNCNGLVDDVDIIPPDKPTLSLESSSLNTVYVKPLLAGNSNDVVRCEIYANGTPVGNISRYRLVNNIRIPECEKPHKYVTTRDEPRRQCYTLAVFDDTGNKSETSDPVCVTFPEAPIDWEVTVPAADGVMFKRLVNNDNLVLLAASTGLLAYDLGGSMEWRYDFSTKTNFAQFVELSYRFLVQTTGMVTAISKSGARLWGFGYAADDPRGQDYNRFLVSDGNIIVFTTGDAVYALDLDGAVRWKFVLNQALVTSPVFGEDGNVYFMSADALVSLSSDNGDERWHYSINVDSSYDGYGKAIVPLDGNIIVGPYGNPRSSSGRKIYAVSYAGELTWLLSASGNTIKPGLPDDRKVYLAEGRDERSSLVAIDGNGNVVWRRLGCCNYFFITSHGRLVGYTVNATGTLLTEVLDTGGQLLATFPGRGRDVAVFSNVIGSPLVPETSLGGIGEVSLDGKVLWHYSGYDKPIFNKALTKAYLSKRSQTGEETYSLVSFDIVKARELAVP